MTSAPAPAVPSAALSAFLTALPERSGFGDATLIRRGPDVIDLGGGNPDDRAVPQEIITRAAASLTADPAAFAASLRYGPAAGQPALREEIARRQGTSADRVVVTAGGAQGMALAVLATLDPGDVVVVDSPVYPLFLRTLDLVGARVEGVPVDAEGLVVDALEERLRAGLRPRAVYTVPTFHNPSGGTLSARRERALLDLADRYGFTLLVDDPYRELSFTGEPPRDQSALLASERAVLISTFSKTLGPGTRLGWLTVPTGQAAAYVRLRNRLDGQSSGLVQAIVSRVLADPAHDAAVAEAGRLYGRKARILTAALREHLGDALTWNEPAGGFFLWARFHGDVDADRLFDAAQAGGVSYQRGEWFAPCPEGASDLAGALRLSWSTLPEDALREGAARLAAASRSL